MDGTVKLQKSGLQPHHRACRACECIPHMFQALHAAVHAQPSPRCLPVSPANPSFLQASKTTPAWRDYVEYMSGIVVDGFGAAITASAAYLLAQMDPDLVCGSHGSVMPWRRPHHAT